jgi:hypothetical protein
MTGAIITTGAIATITIGAIATMTTATADDAHVHAQVIVVTTTTTARARARVIGGILKTTGAVAMDLCLHQSQRQCPQSSRLRKKGAGGSRLHALSSATRLLLLLQR